jgi:hypothetical protein
VYSDFYEIPLPALRFEKVEETDTKVNDTEENDAFQIDHVRSTKRRSVKKSRLTRKNNTQRNSKRFQNNVNKRFQTTKPTTLTRTEQRI